jgi:hypothetical protein
MANSLSASAFLLVAIALSSPQLGRACGVRCVCPVPDHKIVNCQTATCDDSITVYYQGTSYTDCIVWQGKQVQCCGINEDSLVAGAACGGSTLPAKRPWAERLSGKSLDPDASKVKAP